jgi:hypothetical protein
MLNDRSKISSINKLISSKKPHRLGNDYYKRVKNLIVSGYSEDRARFAAMHPDYYFLN